MIEVKKIDKIVETKFMKHYKKATKIMVYLNIYLENLLIALSKKIEDEIFKFAGESDNNK
jgi:hypothetical protein